MKTPVRFSLLLAIVCVLTSCQRDPDVEPPTPEPPKGQDSTLLVKTLTTQYYEDETLSNVSTLKETFTYDIVNRTITILREDIEYEETSTNVLSYYPNGALKKAVIGYPAGYTPGADDPKQMDYTYDAAGVLSLVKMTWGDGHSFNKVYTKTSTGSGYKLSFGDPDTEDNFTQEFDNTGRPTVQTKSYLYNDGTGLVKGTDTETLTYDANGKVIKGTDNFTEADGTVSPDRTRFEFLGRQTKGDNLFNLRRLLLGKALDFKYMDEDTDFTIIISSVDLFDDAIEAWQYSRYPITAAKVWINPLGGSPEYKQFNCTSEFDALGRLKKFAGFYPEVQFSPITYNLEYYK